MDQGGSAQDLDLGGGSGGPGHGTPQAFNSAVDLPRARLGRRQRSIGPGRAVGYSNISRLFTAANATDRREPRLDPALLSHHSEGVILLMGERDGRLSKLAVDSRLGEADRRLSLRPARLLPPPWQPTASLDGLSPDIHHTSEIVTTVELVLGNGNGNYNPPAPVNGHGHHDEAKKP